ncbi:AbiJ-NTD4 domain-containing protein [Burkholderia aenigmatica]|uniref:AbiJ-NTD4 domain-containing protein n=1 Tax=Burkholderia aenigmatica TaxID=2015348 RepID=UPI003B42CDD8
MLTDIFAYRYLKYPIWTAYTEAERRLLNQTISLAKEMFPCYRGSGSERKKIETNETKWQLIHDRLARELGVGELSPLYYSGQQKNGFGVDVPVSWAFDWEHVCATFVSAPPTASTLDVDMFIKERISFIELTMRLREEELTMPDPPLAKTMAELDIKHRLAKGPQLPANLVDRLTIAKMQQRAIFEAQVDELNERFRRAGAPLTFHNGFIQVSQDELVEQQIATPFWRLVADSMWANVDVDMKEALDRRDSNDKDPAIFAAKALESAIKIVSGHKGWTRGIENGAAAYIDNLVSKNNEGFLAVWEGDILKDYFRKVRNSLGHGPGPERMPELSPAQTDWAIETAMSWIRSLIRRM